MVVILLLTCHGDPGVLSIFVFGSIALLLAGRKYFDIPKVYRPGRP